MLHFQSDQHKNSIVTKITKEKEADISEDVEKSWPT